MDAEIEEACFDNGIGAKRGPARGPGWFEVGVYRSVIHHRTVRVEAVSSEAAHDHVAKYLDQIGGDDEPGGIWVHARTELRVLYVQREHGADAKKHEKRLANGGLGDAAMSFPQKRSE